MVGGHPHRYNASMSKTKHVSETPATQFLRRNKVEFGEHTYDYVEHGGTEEPARQLGVDEHRVIKTLVMEDEHARPLIVLMHGDRTVSTKNLARQRLAQSVSSRAGRKSRIAIRAIWSVARRRSAPGKRCRCMSNLAFSNSTPSI